jgi:hypothetical protein
MLINIPCFGLPSIQKELLHDRYLSNVSKITEHFDKFTLGYSDGTKNYINYVTQRKFIELQNGLFIVNDYEGAKYGRGSETFYGYRNKICYNIYYNNKQADSEKRLLEIMAIYDYEINNLENGIEIVTSRVKQTRDERGIINPLRQKITLVFEFDSSNKIAQYKVIDQDVNEISEKYLFHYNDNDKLDSIYMVNNGNMVLYKSVFYDGQLRTLRRPFFNDLQNSNIDEIIILDDNRLKYHLKRYFYVFSFDHQPRLPEDYLTNDKYYFSYLIEFGKNGDQIKQVNYTADAHESNVEYLRYDEKGNWVSMKIGEDKYMREIEYK